MKIGRDGFVVHAIARTDVCDDARIKLAANSSPALMMGPCLFYRFSNTDNTP